MIKISRISSPLKDKIKNVETCSQLDGDGIFEGKYKTSGTVLLKNTFKGTLISEQAIIDEGGVFDGDLECSELIISGDVNGKIRSKSIIIMESGKLSGDVSYKQLAVFEGGIINVAGLKPVDDSGVTDDKVVEINKNK